MTTLTRPSNMCHFLLHIFFAATLLPAAHAQATQRTLVCTGHLSGAVHEDKAQLSLVTTMRAIQQPVLPAGAVPAI
jgi:hypothetical protein